MAVEELSHYSKLKAARFMGLDLYPDTELAKVVCSKLGNSIEANEIRTRARRPVDKKSFYDAVGRILGDLLYAAALENGGLAYRSLMRASFRDSPVKVDTFLAVVNGLISLNYIESFKGGNQSVAFEPGKFIPGLATRFGVTKKLIEFLRDELFLVNEVKKHFKHLPKLNEIRVRAKSTKIRGDKSKGRLLQYKRDYQVIEIKKKLGFLNSFLLEQEYDGIEFYGLRRIFNEGDRDDFNWNMGGRLYAIGEQNYQQLKQSERLSIKINGDAVSELDINASYLRILHGLRGAAINANEDMYEGFGVNRIYIKSWVTATLGHDAFHSRWPTRVVEEFKKAGIPRSKRLKIQDVEKLVLDKITVLQDWPNCGTRWSHLMYQESEAVIDAVLCLALEGVPALPVHDSLIVPKQKRETAKRVLQSCLEDRFKVSFLINEK